MRGPMEARPIVVIGDPDAVAVLVDALQARGLTAVVCSLEETARRLDASAVGAVVFGFPPYKAAVDVLKWLVSKYGQRRPPVVIALRETDTAMRDALLPAGATDVSLGDRPDH